MDFDAIKIGRSKVQILFKSYTLIFNSDLCYNQNIIVVTALYFDAHHIQSLTNLCRHIFKKFINLVL